MQPATITARNVRGTKKVKNDWFCEASISVGGVERGHEEAAVSLMSESQLRGAFETTQGYVGNAVMSW